MTNANPPGTTRPRASADALAALVQTAVVLAYIAGMGYLLLHGWDGWTNLPPAERARVAAALLVLVLLTPLGQFLLYGWHARRHEVLALFPPKAILLYYETYFPAELKEYAADRAEQLKQAKRDAAEYKQVKDAVKADFKRHFDSRYGRSHYALPIALLVLVSGSLALLAARFLLGQPPTDAAMKDNAADFTVIVCLAGAYSRALAVTPGRPRPVPAPPPRPSNLAATTRPQPATPRSPAMPAPTPEGRLLCVSGAAYAITGSEPTLAPDPGDIYLTGAGFVRPPTLLAGGDRDIDACLVGEIPDGVVVAFRGTLPFDLHRIPSVFDWVNDFEADPVPAAGFPGAVHAGFLNALNALAPRILDEVARQRVGALAERPVLITGHSKGGAVAALMAWQLQGVKGIPVKVVTFAAAKPGDGAFRDAYQAAKIDHTRYEYGNDIVPHLPPSQDGFVQVLTALPVVGARFGALRRFDYQPVGVLRYFDPTGQLQDDDATLRVERDLTLAREVVRLRFAQIAMDHAIGCGSGYMAAAAPTGVCPAVVP